MEPEIVPLIDRLVIFVTGIVMGFFAHLLVGKWSLRRRHLQAYRIATELAGTWIGDDDQSSRLAASGHGRRITLRLRHTTQVPFSYILDVDGADTDEYGRIRTHRGLLAVDTNRPWRAVRTLRYEGREETSEYSVHISADGRTMTLTPAGASSDYEKHVLRREA